MAAWSAEVVELKANPTSGAQRHASAYNEDPEGGRVLTKLSARKRPLSPSHSAEPPRWCPSPTKVRPVRIWAVIGGAILAFQLYVWIQLDRRAELRTGTRRGE